MLLAVVEILKRVSRTNRSSGEAFKPAGNSVPAAPSASSDQAIKLDLEPADADLRARELRNPHALDNANAGSKRSGFAVSSDRNGAPMSELGSLSQPQIPSVRSEQRAEERKPVNITAAVLSYCRQKFTSATIVDRSESGAKIKVDQNIALPKVILLVDFQNGPVFECEVRWRKDCYLGVRIIDVYGPARRRRFFETSQLRSCGGFADPPPVR